MKTETRLRGAELKQALVDAAERVVREEGVRALTARRVAADVGVAVGTTYNVFENLDALVTEVNRRTLSLLAEELGRIETAGRSTRDILLDFADGYVRFVRDNRNCWLAVFEIEMPDLTEEVPNQSYIDSLFGFLETAIRSGFPDLDEDQVRHSVRGLWAMVHGLLMLSESNRLDVIRLDDIRPTIEHLVTCHLAGLEAGAARSGHPGLVM